MIILLVPYELPPGLTTNGKATQNLRLVVAVSRQGADARLWRAAKCDTVEQMQLGDALCALGFSEIEK
jgi:hypothetical protein